MKYIPKPDTWFDGSVEVDLVDDYRPDINSGLFCGLHNGKLDEEVCSFDEFIEIDKRIHMKTNLTKKTRALLEQYTLRHASITCNIRRPYVVATCNMGNLPYTGIGVSKWNPNDAGISKWEWNEPRGCDIAIGRAVVDLLRLMSGSGALSNYIEAAELEQEVASKTETGVQ